MAKTKTKKKQVILNGSSGGNQHTLYGSFSIEENPTDFAKISVKEDSLLKHEETNGNFAEHKTLKVEKGDWIFAKQVEYNPFDQSINRIWD